MIQQGFKIFGCIMLVIYLVFGVYRRMLGDVLIIQGGCYSQAV